MSLAKATVDTTYDLKMAEDSAEINTPQKSNENETNSKINQEIAINYELFSEY